MFYYVRYRKGLMLCLVLFLGVIDCFHFLLVFFIFHVSLCCLCNWPCGYFRSPWIITKGIIIIIIIIIFYVLTQPIFVCFTGEVLVKFGINVILLKVNPQTFSAVGNNTWWIHQFSEPLQTLQPFTIRCNVLLIITFGVNGGNVAKRSSPLYYLILLFYHNSFTTTNNRTM
jgi:hypothetical protein